MLEAVMIRLTNIYKISTDLNSNDQGMILVLKKPMIQLATETCKQRTTTITRISNTEKEY